MCMDGQACHTKAHGSARVGQCVSVGLGVVLLDIIGCIHMCFILRASSDKTFI